MKKINKQISSREELTLGDWYTGGWGRHIEKKTVLFIFSMGFFIEYQDEVPTKLNFTVITVLFVQILAFVLKNPNESWVFSSS